MSMLKNTLFDLEAIRAASPWVSRADQPSRPENRSAKVEYLQQTSELARPDLDWAEFGVQEGDSARLLLPQLPQAGRFYLFDGFLGLPEAWVIGDDPEAVRILGPGHGAGSFATRQIPTFQDPRVTITAGLFADTLGDWRARYQGPGLGLIHIDCDLYSSAQTVWSEVGDLVREGTLVFFDELTLHHDRRAFDEWRAASGWEFEYLAAVQGAMHVAVRMTRGS